jgi:hypothetical protein
MNINKNTGEAFPWSVPASPVHKIVFDSGRQLKRLTTEKLAADRSVNADVAGAGFEPHDGAAAIDLAAEVMAILLALVRNAPIHANVARTG